MLLNQWWKRYSYLFREVAIAHLYSQNIPLQVKVRYLKSYLSKSAEALSAECT